MYRFLRRLTDWTLPEAYTAIPDERHNKMLMEDIKHCADRISIRALLTVRQKAGRVTKCSHLICCFIHWGQRPKKDPSKFNTCICLTTFQLRWWEAASLWQGVAVQHKEWRIRPDSPVRPHSTSLKHSWGCQHAGAETEAAVWSMGRASCLNWTPSCSLTTVSVTSRLT